MKDIMRRFNICLNSRRRQNRETAIFEEIVAEIFSELMDTRPQIQENQQISRSINKSTPADIFVKLQNNQNKKKTLKSKSRKVRLGLREWQLD